MSDFLSKAELLVKPLPYVRTVSPIEAAQEMQWEIGMAHPEVATELAQQALSVLGNVRDIYGTRRLAVHTLGAYILNRGRSRSEADQAQFGELYLSGSFGGITYVQGPAESRLQSLMVDMFDVHIRSPLDGRIRPPLTIPVSYIQSVLVAP